MPSAWSSSALSRCSGSTWRGADASSAMPCDGLERLLRLDGELVESHRLVPPWNASLHASSGCRAVLNRRDHTQATAVNPVRRDLAARTPRATGQPSRVAPRGRPRRLARAVAAPAATTAPLRTCTSASASAIAPRLAARSTRRARMLELGASSSSRCSSMMRVTPARLMPSSCVSCWMRRSRSMSASEYSRVLPAERCGADELLALVDAQRLRVHARELGGDADHVERPGPGRRVVVAAVLPRRCALRSYLMCARRSSASRRRERA